MFKTTLLPQGLRSYLFAAFLCCCGTWLYGQSVQEIEGDLEAFLMATDIPGATTDPNDDQVYQTPDEAELDTFRQAIRSILHNDLESAAEFAAEFNYDLFEYYDTRSGDTFAVLREIVSLRKGGGTYVIDLTPERTLVMQCPHPLYDGARAAATGIFLETDAVAFMLAGTHRHNNITVESPCLRNRDPFISISDVAYNINSFFQAAHEELHNHFDRTVSVNFHGMANTSSPAALVISNGTWHQFSGNSLSRRFASRFNEITAAAGDPRFAVSHQEPRNNGEETPPFTGSTNVQGRFTNGSLNPCSEFAPTALFPERFFHMESDRDIRNSPEDWAIMIQLFNELIPLFSDHVPVTQMGDLVITEFMANPQGADRYGEYVEVFNHTGRTIDMDGWKIADRHGNSATFSGTIGPGELFVIGRNDDLNGEAPGGAPDVVWTDFEGDDIGLQITNTGDTISILDQNEDLVASVSYEDAPADNPGVANEIGTGNIYANAQTTLGNYVASNTDFGNGNMGSPGSLGNTVLPLAKTKAQLVVSGDNLQIKFQSAPAVRYELKESLDLARWDPAVGHTALFGDGAENCFELPFPEGPRQFYCLEMAYPATVEE